MSDNNAISDMKMRSGDTTGHWFEGRARRREFWKYVGIMTLVNTGIIFLLCALPIFLHIDLPQLEFAEVLENEFLDLELFGSVFGVLLLLINFYAMLGVTIRRYHDLGMSGWWYLVFFLLGWIPFVRFIAGVVNFILLGCIDGSRSKNKYGPSPKKVDSFQDRTTINKSESSPKVMIRAKSGIIKNKGNVTSKINQNVAMNKQVRIAADGVPCSKTDENDVMNKRLDDSVYQNTEKRLRTLEKLKQQGLIDEAEYKEQKNRVLQAI